MHYAQALPIAEKILEHLRPHCDIINIAGSIRREKAEVKDIEIVCLPKFTELKDMFGWNEGIIREPLFAKTVAGLGTIIKGNTDGKYMQLQINGSTNQPINLDLFMPSDFDYYRQLAIRTGSAEYATVVIAKGWRNIGWCGSYKGLRKISDCIEVKDDEGKHKSWKCINPTAELPPHWKSEEEFFAWITVPYRSPRNREIGSSVFNEAL